MTDLAPNFLPLQTSAGGLPPDVRAPANGIVQGGSAGGKPASGPAGTDDFSALLPRLMQAFAGSATVPGGEGAELSRTLDGVEAGPLVATDGGSAIDGIPLTGVPPPFSAGATPGSPGGEGLPATGKTLPPASDAARLAAALAQAATNGGEHPEGALPAATIGTGTTGAATAGTSLATSPAAGSTATPYAGSPTIAEAVPDGSAVAHALTRSALAAQRTGEQRISLADLAAGRRLAVQDAGGTRTADIATDMQISADDFLDSMFASRDGGDDARFDLFSGSGASTAQSFKPGAGDLARFALLVQGAEIRSGQPSRASDAGALMTTTGASTTPLLHGKHSMPALQPLGGAETWSAGLGDRLLTLADAGMHSARLKLHPENLGSLDVDIQIEDGTAQVWFGTQSTQVRDAIESSMPKLREMFAEQGIQLVRTQVDTGGDRRGMPEQPAASDDGWRHTDLRLPGNDGAGHGLTRASERLLDTWA